jgi:hypothetical protein
MIGVSVAAFHNVGICFLLTGMVLRHQYKCLRGYRSKGANAAGADWGINRYIPISFYWNPAFQR